MSTAVSPLDQALQFARQLQQAQEIVLSLVRTAVEPRVPEHSVPESLERHSSHPASPEPIAKAY